MKYFLLALRLSLRERLRSGRFWCALLLLLAAGAAARWAGRPAADTAVQVGVVIPAGGEAFQEALEERAGQPVQFVFTDEDTARRKVAASQWDCALLLPGDFAEPAGSGRVTMLTGPGSTVYPLVREAAAAALLELSSAQIAADYLCSSGIADEAAIGDLVPRPEEILPQVQRVQIYMETLDGRPLEQLSRAEGSLDRILRGSLAAVLLVWMLFSAVDLGRWRQTGEAARMRPCLGGVMLTLPRLTAALLPAFFLGVVGAAVSGGGLWSVPALIPYLAAMGALALLLSGLRPVWEALPAVIPFAAASVFVLSPVFADPALLFPQAASLCRWMPATLYLYSCEGDWFAVGRLLMLAAVFAAAAGIRELVPALLLRRRSKLPAGCSQRS